MNTRKYPRTMKEAFGPYTSNHIEEPTTRMDWQERVVLTGSIIAALVLMFVLLA
jgi:hypothetical protein